MLVNEKNIVLIGCMGAGKTTIGKMLSFQLERKLVDTDILIEERAGMNIVNIFDRMGEDKFRMVETEIVSDVFKCAGQVVALGGGAVLSKKNRNLIKRLAVIVYLKAEVETLCLRANSEGRPLLRALNSSQTTERMQNILNERKKYYEEADIIISVDNKGPQEVVNMIMERLGAL